MGSTNTTDATRAAFEEWARSRDNVPCDQDAFVAGWQAALASPLAGGGPVACQHGWRGRPPERGERIVTPCPACGSQSLFIGTGGHLTCAVVPHGDDRGCPEPSVESAINALRDAARCHAAAPPASAGEVAPAPSSPAPESGVEDVARILLGLSIAKSRYDDERWAAFCKNSPYLRDRWLAIARWHLAALRAERERCAKVCEQEYAHDQHIPYMAATNCAYAIRALGEGGA